MDTLSPRRTFETKAIAPSLFAHFVLRTSNMQGMIDWYTRVLAMRIVHRNDFICFLSYDDEHHRLALIAMPDLKAPQPGTTGLSHVAYTFRDVGELLATWRRLHEAGIEPWWPVHHGPTLSLYYHDPDGNAVELQVDCWPTKGEATAFFDSETFRNNPIGVAWDPAVLATRYEAGEPEAALLRQPEGPPTMPPAGI